MQTSFDFNEYEIIEYKDIVTFENLLTNHGGYLKERKEQHLRFFNEYFKEIELKNILVEKNYIDKDYLEDYSAYFVRCFVEYPKNCVRLHFFNFVFNEGEIIKLILDGKNVEKYTDGYLGFMVIKPIPNKIIGKTCLATYRNIGKNIKSRYYPATRDYKIHLFGIQFDIKTLAYQEQDSILGACATTALWSAFQATSH